jgi:4'-phosphopantetheinyl transferase EntD
LEKLKDKQEESIVARFLISKLVEDFFWIKNFLPEINNAWIPIFNENIFWSISHKKGIVFVWVSKQKFWLDLEIIKSRDKNVLNIFSDEEYRILWWKKIENFYKIWTVKEALIKYNLWKLDDMEKLNLISLSDEKNIFWDIIFNQKLRISDKEIFSKINEDIVLSLCK